MRRKILYPLYSFFSAFFRNKLKNSFIGISAQNLLLCDTSKSNASLIVYNLLNERKFKAFFIEDKSTNNDNKSAIRFLKNDLGSTTTFSNGILYKNENWNLKPHKENQKFTLKINKYNVQSYALIIEALLASKMYMIAPSGCT